MDHLNDEAGATVLGTYEALLFDMDGTILSSIAAVERAWTAWANRTGTPAADVLAFMHGRRAVDTISHFARPGMDIGTEVGWLDALELDDLDGIVPLPGAEEILRALPHELWAVVTSANRELARRRIQAAGLPNPPYLISSDDVSAGKPHPEGYRRGAASLGVDPARCLVFEDAQAGAQAGLSAGADVVLIAGTQHLSGLPLRAVIRDYQDMRLTLTQNAIRLLLVNECEQVIV